VGLKKAISSRSQSPKSAQTIQKHIRNLNKLQQTYSIRDAILSGNPVTSIRGGDRRRNHQLLCSKQRPRFLTIFLNKVDVLWNNYGQ
jgi:hypothetical protein